MGRWTIAGLIRQIDGRRHRTRRCKFFNGPVRLVLVAGDTLAGETGAVIFG